MKSLQGRHSDTDDMKVWVAGHFVIFLIRSEINFVDWQVELILKLGSDILGDLYSYKKFHQEANELLEELRMWQQDAFAEWSRDILAQIDDPNAPLRWVSQHDRGEGVLSFMLHPLLLLTRHCACAYSDSVQLVGTRKCIWPVKYTTL